MGLIHPTFGSAHIFGLDCQRDAVAVKRKVGYMPGEMAQFGSLRGKEVVAYPVACEVVPTPVSSAPSPSASTST